MLSNQCCPLASLKYQLFLYVLEHLLLHQDIPDQHQEGRLQGARHTPGWRMTRASDSTRILRQQMCQVKKRRRTAWPTQPLECSQTLQKGFWKTNKRKSRQAS